MKQSNSSQRSDQRSKVTDNSPDKYFSELKKENYDSTFPAAEKWLRGLNTKLSTKSTERKISIMKNYFAVNKFKLAYLSVFIIFIVGATTMPVTSHENVGEVSNILDPHPKIRRRDCLKTLLCISSWRSLLFAISTK